MVAASLAWVGALALGLTNASPLEPAKTQSPCAQIANIYTKQTSANATAVVKVPGQLAYDCLNSVPLHQKEASNLMDAILPYVEWQSTIESIKNPPKGYLEPGVDIRAELNKVVQKVKNKTYKSEYAFQADLFRTFNLVHDGHFRFFGDLLTTTLTFQRQIPVVSVSLDGKELPQIYARYDIDRYTAGKGKKPSAFKTVNGVDAVKFLYNWSQLGASQDPDALWNTAFYSRAFDGSGPGWNGYFAGSGRFGYIWPGDSTEVVFQNGTKKCFETLSTVKGNFTGITDGESVYQKFCVPSSTAAAATTPAAPTATTQVLGYPSPIVISSDGVVSGYYLKDQPDVAVLAMLSFEPESPAEFQYVVQEFLAQAKKDGKKKLVVDVQANGGGYIFQGYDTFRQLFPQIVQDGNSRLRYLPATQLIADQYDKIIGKYDVNSIQKADDAMINMYESPFNYKYDYNTQNKHFKSKKDKFGPYTIPNTGKTTNYLRWDFNDPLTTINSTYGFGTDITGYRSRAHNFTQPFAAKDIILLYDGYCASTCTIFSDFMKNQAGVQSVVFGGRPSRDAMQGVGGVKGSQNLAFGDVNFYAQLAYNSGTPAQQKWSNWTQLTQYTLLPTQRSSGTSLNFRDAVHTKDLKAGTTAQFVYEAADCRLFWEPNMIDDVTAIWKATAQATWGSKKCAQGSIAGHYKRDLMDAVEETAAPLEERSIPVPAFPKLPARTFSTALRGQKVPV